MKARWVAGTRVAGIGLLVVAAGAPQTTREWVREYPTPSAREEVAITMNGVGEIWQLHWKSTPKPECEDFAMGSPARATASHMASKAIWNWCACGRGSCSIACR
jgi:hypothetical protein